MLLKDAVLDLRKGRRYGVVGRNGAGKTTLMSTIAQGGVAGMTADVKTLHVKPEAKKEQGRCQRSSNDIDNIEYIYIDNIYIDIKR